MGVVYSRSVGQGRRWLDLRDLAVPVAVGSIMAVHERNEDGLGLLWCNGARLDKEGIIDG
ncbi:hypothetical protein SESBI_50896 [Sesbania bispinosa]|nr:hypothetical protein SESBI_50896 [Sesbania bispinosa]